MEPEVRKCQFCGKDISQRRLGTMYCGKRCREALWRQQHPEAVKKEFQCEFNHAVYCTKKECDACGWNPRVAEERFKQVMIGKGALA